MLGIGWAADISRPWLHPADPRSAWKRSLAGATPSTTAKLPAYGFKHLQFQILVPCRYVGQRERSRCTLRNYIRLMQFNAFHVSQGSVRRLGRESIEAPSNTSCSWTARCLKASFFTTDAKLSIRPRYTLALSSSLTTAGRKRRSMRDLLASTGRLVARPQGAGEVITAPRSPHRSQRG